MFNVKLKYFEGRRVENKKSLKIAFLYTEKSTGDCSRLQLLEVTFGCKFDKNTYRGPELLDGTPVNNLPRLTAIVAVSEVSLTVDSNFLQTSNPKPLLVGNISKFCTFLYIKIWSRRRSRKRRAWPLEEISPETSAAGLH